MFNPLKMFTDHCVTMYQQNNFASDKDVDFYVQPVQQPRELTKLKALLIAFGVTTTCTMLPIISMGCQDGPEQEGIYIQISNFSRDDGPDNKEFTSDDILNITGKTVGGTTLKFIMEARDYNGNFSDLIKRLEEGGGIKLKRINQEEADGRYRITNIDDVYSKEVYEANDGVEPGSGVCCSTFIPVASIPLGILCMRRKLTKND